jgi:CRISPR system Cascade subunit CasA
MNLIGDPWIPVLDAEGKPRQVGLRDLYEQAYTLRDLSATPPQRIALMRLLICITQAALDGPANEREWYDCRDRIVPESLRYLDARQDRFELFGERPFLQVPTLEPKHNAVCDKLDFGLAAGNNTTLYDQSAGPDGRAHDAGWLARMLLTFQCFSPGGLIGTNTWNGDETGKTSEHAPCIEGSPLHLIIRGATVLDALHMNLLSREQVASLPNAAWGQPIWDAMPTRPGALAGDEHSLGYLARLVPMPRAIHLAPDRGTFTLAAGVSYTKLPGYREPSTTVVVRGKGAKERLSHLNINLDKHPWRELGAVLALDSDGAGGPRVLDHLRSLPTDDREIDIWTGGLAADKGKILDVAE